MHTNWIGLNSYVWYIKQCSVCGSNCMYNVYANNDVLISVRTDESSASNWRQLDVATAYNCVPLQSQKGITPNFTKQFDKSVICT